LDTDQHHGLDDRDYDSASSPRTDSDPRLALLLLLTLVSPLEESDPDRSEHESAKEDGKEDVNPDLEAGTINRDARELSDSFPSSLCTADPIVPSFSF
jgi:hypothetical protein